MYHKKSATMKALICVLALLARPALADGISVQPSETLNWARSPEGVAFAALNGDRFAGPCRVMVELPAGLISPAHVKSADMFGLIVSGTMTHVPNGTDPASGAALGPGAYYHIPAGLPHVSSCLSPEPCVTFLYQPGAFAFQPVSP